MATWPSWLTTSYRNSTSPWSVRPSRGRAASVVRRTLSRSPGLTGHSHRTSSTPASLDNRGAHEERLAIHAQEQRARVPARGDEAARRRARGLLVEMEGLGIELARKRDDVVGRNLKPTVFDHLAGRKVLEIKQRTHCHRFVFLRQIVRNPRPRPALLHKATQLNCGPFLPERLASPWTAAGRSRLAGLVWRRR